MPSFPKASVLSEEDVESVSRLSLVASHNTGFSQGTSAMKVSGRLLNFEVDEYLIRHTVARGAKTELQAFCWRFKLDGVVVVTEGDRADLEVLAAHFVAGFVLQEEVDTGKAKYEDILMRLEMAEEEERASILDAHFPNGRVFHGLDLAQIPADCPLLHHCAKEGWASAVQWLLARDFRASLGIRGKHRMTLLHLVAWDGRTEVLKVLGEAAKELCDIPNAYGELPELSGFIRSQQLALEDQQHLALRDDCLEVALACRRLRTGVTCTEDDFVRDANAQMRLASSPSEVLLPVGVDADTIEAQLGSELKCSDFVARFVRLASSLERIVKVSRNNENLERLVLEGCHLREAEAAVLADFLASGRKLTIADFSNNPFGDVGVGHLLEAAHGKVLSMALGATGMTCASLMRVGRLILDGGVEKLNIGANDLAEAADAGRCPQTRACAEAMGRSQSLRSLDLSKTRLLPGQVEHLAHGIRSAPVLETLGLVAVGMPMHFGDVSQRNPFVKALKDPNCNVLRVEVSIVEYPKLWKALMAARRDRCKGQGKGKPVKGKPKDDPTVTTLRLPLDLTARLKCVRQAHPDRVASAVFSTEHFSITADCDTVAFRHEDVGKVFTIHVAVGWRVESTLQAFDGAVANQPAYLSVRSSVESHAGFPALHSLALVFHQREADKVLVVREWSNAAKMLRSRIEDFMLDDSYLLQRRFHVATGKLRRLFPGEALKDLKAADFSSHELSLLAKLSQPDAYQEWRDRALFSARHEVDFHRMREDQDVQAVLRALTTSQQGDATPKFYLPSEEHAAIRVGGQDGERRLDMTATLRLCLLRHFVDKVALVPTCPSPTSRALSVESEDGKWKQVLFLVSVPERLAQSLRPSTRPAQWIPVSELHGALAESVFDAAGGVARLLEGQAAFQLEMGEPEEALKLRRRAVGA